MIYDARGFIEPAKATVKEQTKEAKRDGDTQKEIYEMKTLLIVDRMTRFIQRHEETSKVIYTKTRKVDLEYLVRMSLDMNEPYNRKYIDIIDDCPNMKGKAKFTRDKSQE